MLMSARKHQTGFGLIEVLVSLLIVSIGLLGIASLQIMALKNVGSSMERSQAVIQTYSYLDVLRANRAKAVISDLDVPVMTCDPENLAASKVEQRKWLTQLQRDAGAAILWPGRMPGRRQVHHHRPVGRFPRRGWFGQSNNL